MEDKIQFYNFDTPVMGDMTLTAVWNDMPDPNNPTLENLRLALATGEPQKYYPVGTEIPHTDIGKQSNPWVVLHYGEMPVVPEEDGPIGATENVVNKFGAIIGLKYCETTSISFTYTDNNQLTGTEVIPRFRDYFEKQIPEEETKYFSWVNHAILRVRKIWTPRYTNLTYGNAAAWDYYNVSSQYYTRIKQTGTIPQYPTNEPRNQDYTASLEGLNNFRYLSSTSWPTSAGFGTVSDSTFRYGGALNTRIRYCAFMTTPDETPLNQPEES